MIRKTWPKIRRDKTRNRWIVDLGRVDGKRKQLYFGTKTEAEGEAQRRRKAREAVGSAACALTPVQLRDAAVAYKRLRGAPILDAVDYYLSHGDPHGDSKTVQEVFLEHVEDQKRKDLRPNSIRHTRTKLKRFVDCYAERAITEITFRDIEKWIDAQVTVSSVTRRGYITYLSGLFSFAEKREYVQVNPTKRVTKPKIQRTTPHYMSAADVKKFLAAVLAERPTMIPKLALGFFAGIRVEEIDGLDWSNVNLADLQIRIPGEVAKTGRPRLSEISDNLYEWLRPHAQLAGPIGQKAKCFGAHKRRIAAVADVEFPNNAMRHTFATMHLAMYQNAPKTAHALGHEGSTTLLYRNYAGVATTEEAVEYWKLTPETCVANETAPETILRITA